MTSEKGGDDTLTGVEMGKKEQKLKEITRMRLAETELRFVATVTTSGRVKFVLPV